MRLGEEKSGFPSILSSNLSLLDGTKSKNTPKKKKRLKALSTRNQMHNGK